MRRYVPKRPVYRAPVRRYTPRKVYKAVKKVVRRASPKKVVSYNKSTKAKKASKGKKVQKKPSILAKAKKKINQAKKAVKKTVKSVKKTVKKAAKKVTQKTVSLAKKANEVRKKVVNKVCQTAKTAWNGTKKFYNENKEVIIKTTIRCTELRQIKTDFVFDNYIKLHGKGNKWRVVPISSSLQKQLLKYDRMKNTYFTSRQITIKEDTLLLTRSGENIKSNVAIEKIIGDASIGIEGVSDIRCSPHTLRHYFAKTSIKNGQDIFTLSKLLGYSNIKITQRYLESMNSEEIVQKGLRTSPLF